MDFPRLAKCESAQPKSKARIEEISAWTVCRPGSMNETATTTTTMNTHRSNGQSNDKAQGRWVRRPQAGGGGPRHQTTGKSERRRVGGKGRGRGRSYGGRRNARPQEAKKVDADGFTVVSRGTGGAAAPAAPRPVVVAQEKRSVEQHTRGRFAELDDSGEDETQKTTRRDPRAPRPVAVAKPPTWVRRPAVARPAPLGPGKNTMGAAWCKGKGGRCGEVSLRGRDWADTDSDEE